MRTRSLLPVTLLIGAALLAGCSAQNAPTWTYAPSVDTDAASASQPPAHSGHEAAPPAAAAASGGTLEINAFDLGFEPAQLSVPAPGRYEVKLTNTGGIPHDITFPGGEVAQANARRDGNGRGRRAGRRTHVHLLGPGS